MAAVNTGNNLLFLIVSAMLGFMAVTGLLGWMNIRQLSVGVQLPDELYAGTQTLASIRIENRKRLLPSFLVTATLAGSPTSFLMLDPRSPQTGSLLLSFPRRGLQALPDARISSPFPVNFFVRFRMAEVNGSYPVFPAPRPFVAPLQGGKPDAGQATPSTAKGYEGDLAKISDYTGAESLKLIHWRLSAKHEVFKVKEMTATSQEPVLLEIDQLPGRDLDERLSHGSYLINRLMRNGRPVGLKIGDRVIAAGTTRTHRLKLLTELAVYGQD
ncbi:DUF58 domain-containing protein [Geomonas sp.]|uniref:DUF58 domain-containing protein n=1 Tax=Geomonas sp. TaxID=2651584 RepID=UPI002B48ECEE|nr:DUF58 domain-containing protein [Geomonas sp.]HJV35434.1 DUF58 domain-containing protein [Geomonas sp.]